MDIIRPIFSADDLSHMPDDGKRYEVLEGDLAVSPAPNRRHQRLVLNCVDFFRTLEQRGLGEVYTAPFDVVLDDHNVVEPDVLFVRQERLDIVTDANVQGAPDIVVEILSPDTRDRDLTVKARLYARFGVPEYWVIDPDNQTLTAYRLVDAGYQPYGPYSVGDTMVSPLFPDDPLSVAAVLR